MTISKDNPTGVLRISGTLDIDQANLLRESLLECLLQQAEIVADLSLVDRCDTSALQVLLATRRDAVATGKTFCVTAASPAVTEMAAALGFTIDEPSIVPEKDHTNAS